MDFDAVRSPYWRAYLKLSVKADAFVNNAYFANLVTLTIIAAGIVVGVQTETDVPSDGSGNKSRGENDNWVLDGLESAILVVFAVEMFGKILAEGFQPLRYFHDSWNCFDSVIVSAGFVSVGLDTESGNTLIYLRLFRILRVLKLVKALPELRVFTSSLISGLGSIFFVTVIVFTFFYLFANIGIIFFAENDPMHFGNLQTALLSVFRAATLDDWTDIMYTNMLGCDVWGYSFGDKNLGFDERDLVNDHVNCTHPQALGWVAGAYMVLFIVIGALVLLTLFIGIVATALEEAKDDHKNEIINEKKVFERCVTLGIDQRCTLPVYREIFDDLDVRNEGVLDHEDMKPLLRTLPLMHIARLASAIFAEVEEGTDGSVVTAELEKLQDNWAADSSNDEKANGVCLSGKDIERLVQVVDQNKSGSLEFSEFLLVMDIMKRADEDPSFVGHFRETYLLVKSEKVKRKRTFTARSKSSGSNLFSSPLNSPLCSSTDVINEHSTDGGDGDNDDDDDHAQPEDRHLSGGGLNFSVSDSSPQAIASLEQECAALRKLFYQQALELSPEQSEITEGDPSANHQRAVALRLQNEVLFLKSMTDEISAKVAANESTFTKDIPKSPHGEETKNRFDFSSDHMTPPSNATRPKMKRQTSGPFAVFRRVSAEPPPQRSPRSIDRSFEGLPPLEASVGSFFGSKEPLHTRVHPDPEGAPPELPPDLVDL
jgi:voltage-gated sodium channel